MFALLKSNQAFNRTAAHPLDAGVRIASHIGDLPAIESNRAKAIILKGTLSDEIKRELAALRSQVPPGFSKYRGPVVQTYKNGMPWTGAYIPTLSPFRHLPHTLEHMAGLNLAFRKATGQSPQMATPASITLTTLSIDAKNEAEFRDVLDPTKIGLSRPLCAQRVDRLLCVYSEAAGSGISWLPGTFSYAEEKVVQALYMHSADPDFMLRQYNTQTLEPGDIILVKGSLDGRGRDQLLMHKFTRPKGAPIICAQLQKNY